MKLFSILFSLSIIQYSCISSRTSYTIEDSYPRKGEILDCTIPQVDYNGRQGFEECIYKTNSMKSSIKYQMDKIVDSYLVIGRDTFNRYTNDKKEGKWMEYIPQFNYLRIIYYVGDQKKYTYAIYHGDKIKIKYFNQEIQFLDGDTILVKANDSLFCRTHKIPKTKYPIYGISFYKKNNLRSFNYLDINNFVTTRSYVFYKNNVIGSTHDMVNNDYQVDSIYNQKGDLIYVANEKTKEEKMLGSKSDLKIYSRMLGKDLDMFNYFIVF